MKFRFRRVDWEYASVFRISYRTQRYAETVLVELEDHGNRGRGEALGVSYHGETVDSMQEQLAGVQRDVTRGITFEDLQALLPPGGARNALDCALWDLEAKRHGRRAWQLAGLPAVQPLRTAYTLGLDTLESTARAAAAATQYSLLKLKLNGDGDVERVASVREARPDVELIVDANQAWDERQLRRITPQLAGLRVKLIEQPLPLGKDGVLAAFDSPIPLCADESCQTSQSVESALGKYQFVNIKLDKTGGLTEALRLVRAAKQAGLKLMMGCMGGSSLSMAPGFVVGQWCDVIDLDGPLLAKSDVPDAIRYEGNRMFAPEARLWG
jgi:L-alanine-DL-glutamate epimerase-like enolase superfamily enzyme